jgi:hypothetical protein
VALGRLGYNFKFGMNSILCAEMVRASMWMSGGRRLPHGFVDTYTPLTYLAAAASTIII